MSNLKTSISPTVGATSFTIVGGTATAFTNDGRGVNGANILVDGNSTILLRKKIITRATQPKAAPNANALQKLGRSEITIHTPVVDAAGKTYMQPDTAAISYLATSTTADRVAKRNMLIAVLISANLDDLFNSGLNS